MWQAEGSSLPSSSCPRWWPTLSKSQRSNPPFSMDFENGTTDFALKIKIVLPPPPRQIPLNRFRRIPEGKGPPASSFHGKCAVTSQRKPTLGGNHSLLHLMAPVKQVVARSKASFAVQRVQPRKSGNGPTRRSSPSLTNPTSQTLGKEPKNLSPAPGKLKSA